MKKTIVMVLLLSMALSLMAGLMLSAAVAEDGNNEPAEEETETTPSYPAWLFEPPWLQALRAERANRWREHGYISSDGLWISYGPPRWQGPGPQAPAAPAATPAPSYGRAAYNGIQYSTEVLKQAWIGGQSLQLRLFGENGQRSTFKLSLGQSSTGGIRVTMTDQRPNASAKPVFDMETLVLLMERGVDEIEVITRDGTSTVYDLETLKGMAGN